VGESGSVEPLPTPAAGTITTDLSDNQNIASKRNVSAGATYSWTNPTDQIVYLDLALNSALGAQVIYAGAQETPYHGVAGVRCTVSVDGGDAQARTVEHGMFGGLGLTSGL